jgi:predicted metalloprotease
MSLTKIERYNTNLEMTPDALLDITQSLKFQQIKRNFDYDIGLHDKIQVTQAEIEDVGEALKMAYFFVSPAIIREAVWLAQERKVLQRTPDWLVRRY